MLSQSALETLAIIAYNPKITRAEIESIRGVNSDGTIYKLLEYNLIEEVGRLDAPGRPTMYKVTNKFSVGNSYTLYGALSYTLATIITQYGLQCNRQWLMKVSEQMKAILPQWSTQQMVIETSLR